MRVILDAEAVSALLHARHPAERKVRLAMEAARRLGREVAIATATAPPWSPASRKSSHKVV